ncbi:probable glycosyltransferase [Janibacter sp. HTCC2649]|nr:probable glycosyltransferase [Janibacter sp. HTCC2649]
MIGWRLQWRNSVSSDDVNDLVSVIVPAFQVENYLDECVASLVAQSHRDVEIILVDDGSTDATPELCDAWAKRDERVRVLHGPNGGLSAARNRGLDIATGVFISFVDADDVVSPRYVSSLLSAALTTHADLVMADLVPFTDGGAPAAFRPGSELRVEPRGEVMTRIVSSGIGFASCGKLISAGTFSDLRFRPGSDFEDLEILPRLVARSTTVALSNAAEYGYRQHAGSLMDGHRKLMGPTILQVLDANIEFTRATETDPGKREELVLGYVLHALRTLEATSRGAARRAPGYDAEYRRFMTSHVRVLLASTQISALYKSAALVSVASPGLFVRSVGVAGRLKSTVAPGLRRRSTPSTRPGTPPDGSPNS